MKFAQNFPENLKSQINISQIVSKRVILKKKGSSYSGLCPFHNEKTPSFTVSDEKGFYHCFGCGAHGDIISFTMNVDGLDFKESVIKLANDHNIAIPIIQKEYQEQENEQEKQLKRQYLLLETICNFFEKNLLDYNGQEALKYIQLRGIDQNYIKKFRLGFAPDGYNNLHQYLTKAGFTQKELLASGAIGKNQNGKLYDKFRNRVIFPISSYKNKIIAFGGRSLGDSQPKYLNSSETLLFKKGSNLYNYSLAKNSIYKEHNAIIVEGYMDVIALSKIEINNVVAPLGTALTKEQIQVLFRTTNEIILFLDGDLAGLNAMNKTIDIALPLINPNKILKFALLPTGLDPDDFIKQHGKSACQKLLGEAKPLSETLFDFEAKKIGIFDIKNKISPEKKAKLEETLLGRIESITDLKSKKYFSQYYRDILFQLGRNNKKTANSNIKVSKLENTSINHLSLYAKGIVVLLIQDPKLIDYQDNYCNIRQIEFEDEALSTTKEDIIAFFDKNNNCNSAELLEATIKDTRLYNEIKNKILLTKNNNINNQIKIKILALKYYHHQICKQYQEIIIKMDDYTSSSSIKEGQQKEIFNHKTQIEKEIAELENNLT